MNDFMDDVLKKHPAIFYLVIIPIACVLMTLVGGGWAFLLAGGIP